MDIEKLREVVNRVESKGAYPTQDALWTEVADVYNNEVKNGSTVTKIVVYHNVTKYGIETKTRPAKMGRPRAGGKGSEGNMRAAIRMIMSRMEREAVKEKWKRDHPDWETLNGLRESLGLTAVKPVNNPTRNTFK